MTLSHVISYQRRTISLWLASVSSMASLNLRGESSASTKLIRAVAGSRVKCKTEQKPLLRGIDYPLDTVMQAW